MRWSMHLFAAALSLIGAACSCGGSSGPVDLGDPTITGQLPGIQVVRVGETLTVELAVRNGDGSVLDEFAWTTTRGHENPNLQVTTETGAGFVRVHMTPLRPALMDAAGNIETPGYLGSSGTIATIRAWGGASGSLEPVHDRLDLLVGEHRPTFAFAVPADPGDSPYASLGALPEDIAYRTEDGAVATVTAAGVVTGVGPGTTDLIIEWDGKSASVPIAVTTGSVRRPAPSGDNLDHIVQPFTVGDTTNYDPSHLMDADSREYPAFAAVMEPAGFDPDTYAFPVVIRWTGSGWGAELVGRPWDTGRKPLLTIDDDDDAWVLYWSHNLLVGDVTATGRVPVLAHLGGAGTKYYQIAHPETPLVDNLRYDFTFGGDFGLFPRRGGGVWAMLSTLGEAASPADPTATLCHRRLFLLEATDSVVTHEVVHHEFESACPSEPAAEMSRKTLYAQLPKAPGESFPRLVVPGYWMLCGTPDAPATGCEYPVWLLANTGGAWTPQPIDPDVNLDVFTANDTWVFRDMHVSRDSRARYDRAKLVLTYHDTRPFQENFRHLIIDDTTYDVAQGPWSTRGALGFQRQGFTYVSGSYFGTMLLVRPDGFFNHEPYHRGLRLEDSLAYDDNRGPITAWAASGSQFYLLDRSDFYAVPLPEDLSEESDTDETQGVRLGSGVGTTVAFRPAVFASGHRVVIGLPQGIERDPNPPFEIPAPTLLTAFHSTGPGAAFVPTAIPVGPSEPALAMGQGGETVRVAGDKLYSEFSGQMLVSSDYGATWSELGAADTQWTGWEIDGTGRFVGLRVSGNDTSVYTDDDLDDGFAPTLVTTASVGALRRRPIIGEDGAIYLTWGFNGSLEFVRVQGGVADPKVIVDLGNTDLQVIPGIGWGEADGSLIVLAKTTQDNNDLFNPSDGWLHAIRRDGITSAITITELGRFSTRYYELAERIIKLTDGTLVVAWEQEDDALLSVRVVVAGSSDGGKSWGTPVPVRAGGAGQVFFGMTPEPGGGLLMSIGDNASMSGDILGAPQLYNFFSGGAPQDKQTHPRMDDLVIHVDSVPTN